MATLYNHLSGDNVSNSLYFLSSEEVLADKNGYNFLIKSYNEELNDTNISLERKSYLNLQIEKAKAYIEFEEINFEIFTKK